MEVRVNNRLMMRLEDLPKGPANQLRALFEHNNPEYHKKRRMSYGIGNELPVIVTWKHVTDDAGVTWLTLPRGGTKRLRHVCGQHGIHINWIDEMCRGDVSKAGGAYTGDWVTPQIFPDRRQIPWDHQELIVEAVQEHKQGVIRSCTGSGKTSALIEAIRQCNVPAIVVVWETGLLEQWQKRIHVELGIKPKHQGLIQGSKCRLRPITMAMQQTMNNWDADKWKKIRGVFGFVGTDEIQRYAADTFIETIDKFDSGIRIGVSADETRRDHKEFLIYDLFGEIILDIPEDELQGKGLIHEVECNIEPTEFEAGWYVEEHKPSFSTLIDQIVMNEARNERIVQIAKRRHAAGETLLLFTHRVEHCHTLRRMLAEQGIAADYMLGGPKHQKEFVKTLERMRDLEDPLRIAIGTLGKVGVGLDIPNLTVGIACTPIHNNKQFMNQVKGRISRRCTDSGKTGAELVYMWDREVFGRVPLINLKRWNKTANVNHHHKLMDVDQYLKEHHEEAKPTYIGPFTSAESLR